MKTTLYTGTTHQDSFTTKLSKILDKPDSSIAVAFMASLVNGGAFLFLATDSQVKKGINLSVKSSSFLFNFSKSFGTDKDTKANITSSGISEQDLKDLTQLFDEYTFENPAEANFFASKFFYKDDEIITDPIVYLHFKASDYLNTCVIDGKKLYKSYGIIKKEELVANLVKYDSSNSLTELDLVAVARNPNKNFILDRIKGKDLSQVAYEVYFDMVTNKFYVGNLLRVVDGETIEESVSSIL